MNSVRLRHRLGAALGSLLLAGTTAACGTRVERLAEADGGTAVSSVNAVGSGGGIATDPVGAVPVAPGSPDAIASPTRNDSLAAGNPTNNRAGGARPATPGTTTPTRGQPGSPAVGGGQVKGSTPDQDGSATTGGVGGLPGPAPAAPTRGSPVRLGSVGTLSGPVGATLGGVVKGAQVWVRWINDQGGLNGHPIEYKVWDDGGDPARHRAQVQEAVERTQVVAFLAEAAVLTAESTFEYLQTKQIPVIGTDATPQFTDKWPMYFLQVAYGKAIVFLGAGTVARRAAILGVKKFGTITCTEIQQCSLHKGWWHEYTTRLGLASAYKGEASLVQPDFTAECLAARNAGAEILAMSMDANSINRIASSCARQNYRPIYATLGPNMVQRYTDDKNLDGMILGANVLPYLAADNPAMAEFLDAMKRYAPGIIFSPSEVQGWVAGKLLERAASSLGEPPTTAAVLQGLWSVRNESLGGLTQPLSYTQGKPTSQDQSCGFDMVIQNGAWTSPDNYMIHCGNPK